MSWNICPRVDSESATKAVTCLSLQYVVVRSPVSLKKYRAWGSHRAVGSQQPRLANGHPSLLLLEPPFGAGENPWASVVGINRWFILPLPPRGKKAMSQVAFTKRRSDSLTTVTLKPRTMLISATNASRVASAEPRSASLLTVLKRKNCVTAKHASNCRLVYQQASIGQ